MEFSYTSDSLLAAIDRYLYETDGTLDPVARSSFTYTDGDLTGLVHADPLEAILREYDWTYQNGRIATEDSGDGGAADVMYTYDTDGQLSGVLDLAGTGRSSGYNYDDTGNRTNGNDSNGYAAYTVDDFNRLDRVTVTKDLVVTVYRYDYDAEGNRIRKYTWTDADNDDTVDWNATEISDWTEYTWDHRNRLIQVESGAAFETTDVTVTFAYDYLNRWIATEVDTDPATPGDETGEYFVYGQATLPDEVASWDRAATDARDIGQIALRLNEDGEISNRYLWGAAVDQILADEQISWTGQAYSTNRTLWPLTDHQGTVRDLAEVNGSGDTEIVNTRTYDAYGNLISETAPAIDHLFGFTGHPTEGETGLQNNLNRWYDPEVGTWLNEDPITFQGGDANLSRYCGNDPVNMVDPSGLWDISDGGYVIVIFQGGLGMGGVFSREAPVHDEAKQLAFVLDLKKGTQISSPSVATMREIFRTADRDDIIVYYGHIRHNKLCEGDQAVGQFIGPGSRRDDADDDYTPSMVIADLNKIRNRKPALLIIAGCRSELLAKEIQNKTGVPVVIGTDADTGNASAKMLKKLLSELAFRKLDAAVSNANSVTIRGSKAPDAQYKKHISAWVERQIKAIDNYCTRMAQRTGNPKWLDFMLNGDIMIHAVLIDGSYPESVRNALVDP